MKRKRTTGGVSKRAAPVLPVARNPATNPLESNPQLSSSAAVPDDYLGAFDGSPDGHIVLRARRAENGDIVDFEGVHFNPAASRILGAPLGDLQGRQLRELFQGDAADEWFDRCATVVSGGTSQSFESARIDAGVQRWSRNVVLKFRDGVMVTLHDVTDQHRQRDELRNTEELYRSLNNAIPQIVFMANTNGIGLYVNDQWYEYTGVEPGGDTRQAWLDALHPEDRETGVLRWRENIARGEPYETEYRFRRRDGEFRWHLVRAVPVRNEAGAIVRWFGTQTDIHDRKLAEEKLRANEHLIRVATQAAHLGIWDLDLQTRELIWDATTCRLFGVPLNQRLTLESFYELIDPRDRPKITEGIEEALRNRGQYSGEYRIVLPDGQVRWLLGHGSVIVDDLGRALRIAGVVSDITDRKKADDELRSAELRWRRLMDANVVGVVIADVNRVIDVNQKFLDMVGYSRDEIIDDARRVKLTPPEFAALDSKATEQLLTTGAVVPFEKEFVRKDGSRIPVLITGSRLAESPLAWIGFMMDLTERKQAEQQSRVNELRWRRLMDANIVGLVIAHENGIVDANQGYLDIIGYTREEMLAGNIDRRSLTPPEHWHLDDEAVAEVRKTGAALPFEKEYIRRDGTRVPVLIAASLLHESPTTWVGIVLDLTERKRAEAAVRQNEEQLRVLTEAAPVFLYSMRPSGEWDYASPYFYEFTGLQAGSALKNGWLRAVHPGDTDKVRSEWRRARPLGEPYEIEYRLRRADGVFRWFKARTDPIRDASGTIIRWYGGSLDIHVQKEAQEALRETDRRKDEFLAMLAHELRNPLAPIVNAVEIMRLTDGADGRIRWARDVIERQTAHLKRLVDDLLDVSRVTTGRINLQKETVELKTFVMHAVEAARPSIESRRHRLSVDIEQKPVYVLGDSVRLTQAVLNLLNNACRYTPDGGDIRVDAKVDGDDAVIRVRDNGQGIASDLLPYIFDLFTQADRKLDRSEGGLGIGLTVVRRLVELHDGRVEALSDGPGRGSEFVIRLPLVAGSASVLGKTSAEREETHYPARRILVVDDNEDCAESLGALLSISGYEVRTAHDGQSAIEAVRNEIPAVVLLDLGLPDLNGYEIARRLRAMPHGREILLIAVTGYGQASDRERSKEAGFDYHLVKPVDPFELLDKLGGDKAQA